MSVVKNNIPILEYDTEDKAVIMPGHNLAFKVSNRAVMLFMEKETEEFAKLHNCELAGKFQSITKIYNVYKTVHKGKEIVFVQAPLGGAAAVQIMEQLIACGAKEIIAVGCCGALVDDTEGEFFIPVYALRQEGTSYHYLQPEREIDIDEKGIKAIETALKKSNIDYKKCKTWTTDGFYRETKEMVLYRKEEGYSVVEMECASLAACGKRRGITFAQLLFTADSLANEDVHNGRNWGEKTFQLALKLAMDAVVEV